MTSLAERLLQDDSWDVNDLGGRPHVPLEQAQRTYRLLQSEKHDFAARVAELEAEVTTLQEDVQRAGTIGFLEGLAEAAQLREERASVISATHALVAEFNPGAGWPATDPPLRPLDLLLFEVQDALRAELSRLREENAALTEALGRDDKTLAVLDQEIQAWMALEERARKAIQMAEEWGPDCPVTVRELVAELVAVVRAYLADEEETSTP